MPTTTCDENAGCREDPGLDTEESKVNQIHEPRLAVLIDADNTSAKWAEAIFREVATLGEASVRRIYGDFSGTNLRAWEKQLEMHAVIPHQQFAYTQGKNSSDIALVIDAMDLLHAGRFDGFVLVSSDSDFTRLAGRIREQGLLVYGIGKNNTPSAFRKACKQFIFIENLVSEADDAEKESAADERTPPKPGRERAPALRADTAAKADANNAFTIKEPPSKAVPLIAAAMRSRDEDWVSLSVIGSYVRQANPEFDPRTYGCQKLTELLEKTGQFEVNRNDTPARARLKRMR